MTITSQQVDAWDAEVDAAYEAGRQEGMKQERALWTLSKLGQEIEAQPEQELVDFASLLREAEEIVQSKPTWKRFIDGTPLANDIAVWMTVFAQDVARRTSPPQRPWVGLTDREIDDLYCEHHDDYGYQLSATGYERAIEAKLKEKNT